MRCTSGQRVRRRRARRPRRQAAGGHRLAERGSRRWRRLRGLHDHGVASDEGRREHVHGQRHREVERRDHAERPVRPERLEIAFARSKALKRGGESVGRLDHGAVGLDQIDRLLHLGNRLHPSLAGLEAHDGRELDVTLADRPCHRAHVGAALAVWHATPLRPCAVRRPHRRGHRLGAGRVRAAEVSCRVGWIATRKQLTRCGGLSADDVGEGGGRGRAHIRKAPLELFVERAAQSAAGVGQTLAHVASTLMKFGP
jgi:hypothetical protein